MIEDYHWEKYTQALRELPSVLATLFLYLLIKITFSFKLVPEKYIFTLITAPSTANHCIHTLVDYRNPYSKYTYWVFCGLIVGLILAIIGKIL